ncbi:MAG TPA: DMT family transporter [Hyphomicrobiaceae bacterium]|nr:DMT family transporter [Hyphomicrobiaceae bacterium]
MPSTLPAPRTIALTVLAMFAFAANSLLCRLALADASIDPATFTAIRIASGVASLWLIVTWRDGRRSTAGSWPAAAALFGYAIAFAVAYVTLSAGTGALILFGAVQATMIAIGIFRGERLSATQLAGLAIALGGLVLLLAPGATAPSPVGAVLMALAGMSWGVYSLLGRGAKDPLADTAGNFLRALPMAALTLALAAAVSSPVLSAHGVLYAILSGAVASGIGYAIWYAALPGLSATQGASVQLSVPVITAVAAAVMLDELISARLVIASVAVLGGIALVIASRQTR